MLVIASKQDRIVGAPDEAALPANIRLAWIQDAGHMPHMERPGEVQAAIEETVARAG